MRIIQFKDIIPDSPYALLTSSFFREQAVRTIIHCYRSWKHIKDTPLNRQRIQEPNDDGFYQHLASCVQYQNFHHIHYNTPDFIRRLFGALRHNIINLNEFLTIHLLYEFIDGFHSGKMPENAHKLLKKYNISHPAGPFTPQRFISYWGTYENRWLNFLSQDKLHQAYMHYYTLEVPQPFVLAFLYFALTGPQYEFCYDELLINMVLRAKVAPALIQECLADIQSLKQNPTPEKIKKIKHFLNVSYPKEQHQLTEQVRKINTDSMRFLALLYKIKTQIPTLCEHKGCFYFILLHIEALNQLQKIAHLGETMLPSPVLGPISTRMIRAYDEIPEKIKSGQPFSSGQQLLNTLFPDAQKLKQATRPVEIRHPDVIHNHQPHGYQVHPFFLSWHDLFHAWRAGCHYKGIIRQFRLIFDEKAGLVKSPIIMSKIIWRLTDMDYGFSTIYRNEKSTLSAENQLDYYVNLVLWFFYSSPHLEDSLLYQYHLFKPGHLPIPDFLSIQVHQLESYLKLTRRSKTPHLYDNLLFLVQQQNRVKEHLQKNPNAHFMEVYLSILFEPKYDVSSEMIQYFQDNGYENCFEWTKNDGIHFSSLWFPNLQPYGLKKRVSENNIAILYEGLMARVVRDNHFHGDLKPYESNQPINYTPKPK